MTTKQKTVTDKLKINYATKTQIDNAEQLSDTELYLVDLELPDNKVIVTDENGNFAASNITSTELSKLAGVTDNIQNQILREIDRAQTAEENLNTKIEHDTQAINTLNSNLTSEINRATQVEQTIQQNLNSEIARALTTEGNLADLTTQNKVNLVNAINELNSNVHTNTEAITTINTKIPEQATANNQLADKAFVNSSVATSTANFIGTFQNIAQRDAYTGPLTNNDYCFIVGVDSAGNTIYDRYKWTEATNPASWLYEYSLNNSSFTANQWAAINSNATAEKITQITTNKEAIGNLSTLATSSKTNLVSAINELNTTKQENLIEGTGIAITNNVISLNANLASLNDINLTSPQNKDLLIFNQATATWTNYALTEIDGGQIA